MVLGMAILIYQRSFPIRGACIYVAGKTQRFTHDIRRMAATIRKDPSRPVVFVSRSPMDVEPLISVQRFLRADGVNNPIIIALDGYGPNNFPAGSFEQILAKQLETLARQGGNGYAPPETATKSDKRFIIDFSGETSPPSQSLGRIN
jgi:hypothetical protein